MNHDFLLLLVCLAIIAILAGLLFAAGRAHMSALTSIGELRSSLDNIHLDNEKIHHAIQLQRPVLYDAHKRISVVTKPSKNLPAKPRKINGRISPIRP